MTNITIFLDLRRSDIMRKASPASKLTVSKLVNRNIKNLLTNDLNLVKFNSKNCHIVEAEKTSTNYGHEIGWQNYRTYFDYNNEFKYMIDRRFFEDKNQKYYTGLIDMLVGKYKQTQKTIEILDDGTGQGNFLADIKQILTKKKIPVNTTAISLSDKINAKNRKYIDRFIFKDAKDIVLTKKYDLITSYYGAINYSIPAIRNELIKKYVFSLNKNGIGLFLFTEHKRDADTKNLNFLKLLEKVGFSTTIYKHEPNTSTANYILLIERLR